MVEMLLFSAFLAVAHNVFVQNLRTDAGVRKPHTGLSLAHDNHLHMTTKGFPRTDVARNVTGEHTSISGPKPNSSVLAFEVGKHHQCVHTSWASSNGRLIIFPTEGLGNRMRLISAGVYIARALQRTLSVVWPEMEALHHKKSGSISFTSLPSSPCYVIDCHKQPSLCLKNFQTLTLDQLFPKNYTCILVKSFSPLEKYLLDNFKTHAQIASQRNVFTPKEVWDDFLCTLTPSFKNEICGLGKALRRADVSLSLHIRTMADPTDGGKVRNLYKPQLLCLARLQRHFESQNFSTAVFFETDATFLKDPTLLQNVWGVSSLFTLPTHAHRSNIRDTLLFWILLHEVDMPLTSHSSSLGMTGAERSGGPLPYALPNKHSFRFTTSRGEEATHECGSPLASTATHDLTHILVPSECTEIYPECPSMGVDVMVALVRKWRQTRGVLSRDWCV